MSKTVFTEENLLSLQNLAHLKPTSNQATKQTLVALQNIVKMVSLIEKANIDLSEIDIQNNSIAVESLRQDESQQQDSCLESICQSFNPKTKRIKVPQVIEK